MDKLKIAVQKSGRLSEKSLELLSDAGINLTNGNRKLISVSSNFPVDILYLRDDDIPQYVTDKVADAGIVGENVVMEKAFPVKLVHKLGFARCRLSLAIPKNEDYISIDYFNSKKIATSYPAILTKYLAEKHINAEIHILNGSVEITPALGLADAIFDIVSSGSTLISNGLKEVEVVMNSEAVLICSDELDNAKTRILNELVFRFKAVQSAQYNKYILLNAPNDKLDEIIRVIPGMKSPTIMPLAETGWSSVHSVIRDSEFWEIIGKLESIGAQGILVIPIEKMIVK